MKGLRTMVVVVVALTPLCGRADGLSYSYWDLAYISADVDGLPSKLDGYGVAGSVELSERIFAFASFAKLDTTIFGIDAGEKDFGVGLGYAWPLAENFDLIGRAGYAQARVDVDGLGRGDDEGYNLGVALRTRFADAFEVEGGVNYVDLKDSGDSTSVGAGLQWYFVPQVAVTVSGAYADEGATYSLGFRGTWGRN